MESLPVTDEQPQRAQRTQRHFFRSLRWEIVANTASFHLTFSEMRLNLRGMQDAPNGCMAEEKDPLTEQIIGCAIEVHKELGPGLLESAYEIPMRIQLAKRGLKFDHQRIIPLMFDGVKVGDYRPDLIVEDEVIVEIKSVLRFEPVFVSQMLTYLKITGKRRGLIINFNKPLLKQGIQRVTRFEETG
jgi:GxxExxY protein